MRRIAAVVLAFALALAAVPGKAQDQGQDLPSLAPLAPLPPPFDFWMSSLRAEAVARGIRPEIVDRAFAGVEPVGQILERDRAQAEFTLDLSTYLSRRLTRRTTRTAQEMYGNHRTLLHRIGERYGVSPRVLIAVWGLESNFGRFSGVRPTIPTLTTLAFDDRRGAMFRNELLSALEILNRGDIEIDAMKGSWAGALGQPQFMPSSYLLYAQDFDGDGRRDIWQSEPDVFASVANYLKEHGWTAGTVWGREVKLPGKVRTAVGAVPLRETGCRAERSMTEPRPLSSWRRMGVRTLSGTPVPSGALKASLMRAGSRSFLLYSNYEAILAYNCAHTYALSVALLSDRLH
jgi:membrane-bound lytic murein transglycosylase B